MLRLEGDAAGTGGKLVGWLFPPEVRLEEEEDEEGERVEGEEHIT